MKKYLLLPVLLLAMLLPAVSFSQNGPVIDRLAVPGPLSFGGKSYNLVRSSYVPDTATYNTYKQEYLAADDTLEIFKTLLQLTIITGNTTVEDVANAKLDELRELKLTNPIVNFEPFSNKKTGEFMIDFLTSENSPDGQYIDMAERSVYRYKTITAKSGEDCIVLFAVVIRSYGDDVDKFLSDLKSKARINLTRDVGKFVVPDITIAK